MPAHRADLVLGNGQLGLEVLHGRVELGDVLLVGLHLALQGHELHHHRGILARRAPAAVAAAAERVLGLLVVVARLRLLLLHAIHLGLQAQEKRGQPGGQACGQATHAEDGRGLRVGNGSAAIEVHLQSLQLLHHDVHLNVHLRVDLREVHLHRVDLFANRVDPVAERVELLQARPFIMSRRVRLLHGGYRRGRGHAAGAGRRGTQRGCEQGDVVVLVRVGCARAGGLAAGLPGRAHIGQGRAHHEA
mmetsp:Transcript_12945/g.33314  ORF Transcript_12945/g.33314 Transcript_12945/m.33314 type:complete len:247 (-) Transcript_12945:111-851(-)